MVSMNMSGGIGSRVVGKAPRCQPTGPEFESRQTLESFVAAVFLKKIPQVNRVFEKEQAFSSPASRPTTRPSTGFPVSIRKIHKLDQTCV